jgi:hypothetical protein
MFGAADSAALRAPVQRAAPRSRAVVAAVAGDSKKILMMGACASRTARTAQPPPGLAPGSAATEVAPVADATRCPAGGTRFIGLYLARQLVEAGHEARLARAQRRHRALQRPAGAQLTLASRLCRATASQVTLFTRGKTPIAQQIPDDTAASFKAYESKIKHIKGNRQASATRECPVSAIGCALRCQRALASRARRTPTTAPALRRCAASCLCAALCRARLASAMR